MQLCCSVTFLLIFMAFLFFVSFLSFYALSLGNWLGKEEINGDLGESCGTQ
jgi:hypothetical protein